MTGSRAAISTAIGTPPEHLRESAESDDDLFIRPVVFYELWRGLRYRDAARQLTELKTFAGTLQWVEYNRAMWEDAAELWAGQRRRGERVTTPTC
jgi:predicted nucleic acid-binding protein